MEKILIIEDDPGIIKGLEESLSSEGFEVSAESDGEKGYAIALKNEQDLLILDLMLPSMSGLDICKNLRMEHINTPIIMLTAKTKEMDKVLGLELGADDYVTKPFSMKELTARIKALLRRRNSIHYDFETYELDDIKINFKKMETTKAGKKIKLSERI
ncbi:MAG: response regulator transcription factor [Ignavibacteria bacterium]